MDSRGRRRTSGIDLVDQTDDDRAIHALEDQIEAAAAKNDAGALSALRAPDYLVVSPAGQRHVQLVSQHSTLIETR